MTPRGQEEVVHNDAFTRWMMGVIAALMTAAVIGLFTMSNTLARIDERVAVLMEKAASANNSIMELTKTQQLHEQRINNLEKSK